MVEAITRNKDVLIFPISDAHLMDASTVWRTTSKEHRQLRYKHMLFADGISSFNLMIFRDEQLLLDRVSMYQAADDRGHFTILDPDNLDLTNENMASIERIQKSLIEARETLSKIPDEESRQAMKNMLDALEDAYSDGGVFTADPGMVFSNMFSFLLPLIRKSMPFSSRLMKSHPAVVVNELDRLLQKSDPTLKNRTIRNLAQQQTGDQHIDDIGPQVIGMFGYHSDKTKVLRKGSPGVIADGSHARFALESVMFVTGDRRLGHRVDAWAHYTDRGLNNQSWPIVSIVNPEKPEDFLRTARLIDLLGGFFRRQDPPV